MIALFDIDGTICDTPNLWLKWITSKTGHRFYRENMKTYSSFAKEISKIKTDIDLYDFWRQEDLYDEIKPYKMAVKMYNDLKENNYTILFVSHCNDFPEHIKSKQRFLKEYFHDYDGFISTDKKELILGDMLIDDNPKHIIDFLSLRNNVPLTTFLSEQFYNKDERKLIEKNLNKNQNYMSGDLKSSLSEV